MRTGIWGGGWTGKRKITGRLSSVSVASPAKRQFEARQYEHKRPSIRPIIGRVSTELAKATRMKSKTAESMSLLMMHDIRRDLEMAVSTSNGGHRVVSWYAGCAWRVSCTPQQLATHNLPEMSNELSRRCSSTQLSSHSRLALLRGRAVAFGSPLQFPANGDAQRRRYDERGRGSIVSKLRCSSQALFCI